MSDSMSGKRCRSLDQGARLKERQRRFEIFTENGRTRRRRRCRRRVGGKARLRKYRLIISYVLRASRVLYSWNTQRRRRLRADATKIEERPVDSGLPPGQKCVARPRSLLARLRRRSVRRSPPNSCFHYSLGASSFRSAPVEMRPGEHSRPQLGSKPITITPVCAMRSTSPFPRILNPPVEPSA